MNPFGRDVVKAWGRLGPQFLPFADAATPEFPLDRLLRLSLFQLSVGMATVLLTGTLNRVMIVELVVAFALREGVAAAPVGDGLMLAAIVVCGLGYAEGGRLSRALGGWQVICWALVIALPVMLSFAIFARPISFAGIAGGAWIGLAYVSLFSMLIGFMFWYRGLARGGIAAVGQLQLLQPFFGLALAAALLGERVSLAMLVATLGVVGCVAGARKFAT